MRKIATLILVVALLIGVVTAQVVSICPWDEDTPEELVPASSSITSVLVGTVYGFADISEAATMSELDNVTFTQIGTTFFLHSGLGGLTLGHSTEIGNEESLMSITQSNAMSYDGSMSMLVGDTHLIHSVNPIAESVDENTSIPCAWCEMDFGGSSADLRTGSYVSETGIQAIPFANELDYIAGVGGMPGIQTSPFAVGSFTTHERAFVISGEITNGTVTSDFEQEYSFDSHFIGNLNLTRIYSRTIQYPN